MSGTVNMKRQVPEGEFKALVTVEATERLIRRALRVLGDNKRPSQRDVVIAKALLEEAIDEASVRTCTAVQSLALSDLISKAAAEKVDQSVLRVREATKP